MITREEAIRRLDDVAKEIIELRKAFEEEWKETFGQNATQIFLEKCRGWEDDRSPEEIISQIYQTRTVSDRGKAIFNEEPS